MQKTNKDYFVKGSRWWWYSFFLIIFNIVTPAILATVFGILFVVEGDYEFIFQLVLIIPVIILLVILTIKFIKNTLKKEQGFSRSRLIFISIIYFLYICIALMGIALINEYLELSTFKLLLITMPFALGPLLLLVNFLTSHIYHKKGVIPADEKNKSLAALGIISIIESLFFPIIFIGVFCCYSLVKSSGNSFRISYNAKKNKNLYCKKCGALIDKDANFCTNCGEKIN